MSNLEMSVNDAVNSVLDKDEFIAKLKNTRRTVFTVDQLINAAIRVLDAEASENTNNDS